jgi:hypothetical protein
MKFLGSVGFLIMSRNEREKMDGGRWRYIFKFGNVVFRDGKYYRNDIHIKNPWDHWGIKPWQPSAHSGLRFSKETTDSKETVGKDKDLGHFRRIDDSRWYYKNDPYRNEAHRYHAQISLISLNKKLYWDGISKFSPHQKRHTSLQINCNGTFSPIVMIS